MRRMVKHATAAGVASTIKMLGKVANAVSVKRKYKTARDNLNRLTHWWFVLREEECSKRA